MAESQELRFVIKADGAQATAEVKSLSAVLNSNLGGGSQFATAALRGVNTELANFVRQAPLVGQPLAAMTRELFKLADVGPRADASLKAVGNAAKTFETQLGQAFLGGTKRADELALTFGRLGVNLEKGIGNSKVAFGQFITGLSGIANAEDRAAVVAEVFRGQTAKVLPVLEAQVARMTAATVATDAFAVSEEAATVATVELEAAALPLTATLAIIAAGLLVTVGGAVAVTAALFKSSEAAADYGEEIFKAGQRTGLAAEFLSVAKVAAEETGTSFEALTREFARFEINISRAITAPTGQAAVAFGGLKLKAEELRALKPEEAIREIATRLENLSNVEDRNRIAVALGGREFLKQIGALKLLGAEYDETLARTKALGLYFSGDGARQAALFNRSLRDLELAAKGLAVQIGGETLPIFIELINVVGKTVIAIGPLAKVLGAVLLYELQQVADEIKSVVAGLLTLPTVLQAVAQASAGNFGSAAGLLGQTIAEYKQNIADLSKLPTLRGDDRGDDDAGLRGRERRGRKGKDPNAEELKRLETELKATEETYRREVEANKRKYDLFLESLADFTTKEIAAEEARYKEKQRIFLRERALVKDNTPQADAIDQKLREADDERTANIQKLNDERNKKEQDAERAQAEAIFKIEEERGQLRIGLIKEQLKNELITRAQAEDQLFAVEQAAREHRLELLRGAHPGEEEGGDLARAGANPIARKKVLDEIELINRQEETAQQEHDARLEAIREADARDRYDYAQTIRAINEQLIEDALRLSQAEIDALIRNHGRHKDIRAAEAQQAIAEETARHERNVRAIRDEEDRVVAEARTYRERFALHKLFDERIEQEDRRHRRQQADDAEAAAADDGSLKARIKKELDDIPDISFKDFGIDAAIGSFKALKTAILDSVDAFVFGGATIGQVFRRTFAELAASLAKEALLQALKQAALSLGALAAGDLHGAAKHAAAAAGWTALGVAAAVGGRALAGSPPSANAYTGASGGGAGGSAQQGPQYAQFNYGGQASFSAAQANAPGSQNLGGTLSRLNATLDRLDAQPAGHVVTIGLQQNPSAAGVAVLTHQAGDQSFTQELFGQAGFR